MVTHITCHSNGTNEVYTILEKEKHRRLTITYTKNAFYFIGQALSTLITI
jgi:hypothetical protein